MRRIILLSLLLAAVLAACNKNDLITRPSPPEIVLNGGSNVFAVKTGRTLCIAPDYLNAQGATYRWTAEGAVVGTEASYTYRAGGEPVTVYLTLEVATDAGTDRRELRIDVLERQLPTILLPGADEGFSLVEQQTMTFTPTVDERLLPVAYCWTVAGREVSDRKDYTFGPEPQGSYALTLTASNEDGEDRIEFTVSVYSPENLPFGWTFDAAEYSATVGRGLRLEPATLTHAEGARFLWRVDGQPAQSGDAPAFDFTPSAPGDYTLEGVMEKNGLTVVHTLTVHAYDAGRFYRPRTAASTAAFDRIYAYTPAPGQFINAGSESIATAEQACAYAQEQLAAGGFVSLGAFGGFLVAGFDHSVDAADEGYDLAVGGNSFDTSSEPGVVWVMQDENGDGLPNDTWYELRGSEYDDAGTLHGYAVTYHRPAKAGVDVPWTDDRGGQGAVERNVFHLQDSYYPAWVADDRYTLRGTRLENRAEYGYSDHYGEYVWMLPAREWGYADNYSDTGRDGTWNLFRIADAVRPDGTPAGLPYIDFVKVQSAVQAVCGPIGETSTELTGIADYRMMP